MRSFISCPLPPRFLPLDAHIVNTALPLHDLRVPTKGETLLLPHSSSASTATVPTPSQPLASGVTFLWPFLSYYVSIPFISVIFTILLLSRLSIVPTHCSRNILSPVFHHFHEDWLDPSLISARHSRICHLRVSGRCPLLLTPRNERETACNRHDNIFIPWLQWWSPFLHAHCSSLYHARCTFWRSFLYLSRFNWGEERVGDVNRSLPARIHLRLRPRADIMGLTNVQDEHMCFTVQSLHVIVNSCSLVRCKNNKTMVDYSDYCPS